MGRRVTLLSRRRALLAAFAAFGLFWGGFAASLPAIKRQAGVSEAELGLALLCVATAAMPAMLLTGPFANRLGERAPMLLLPLFAAAALGPALAHSLVALAGAFALLGAASGAVDVAINAGVAANERETGRQLMARAHAMFPLGALAAGVAAGAARNAGVDVLLILGAIALLIVLAAPLGARSPRPETVTQERRKVRGARLLALGGLCAVAFVIENAVEGWSAIHLEETLDGSPLIGGLGPGLFSLSMFIGRMAADAQGGRVAERWLMTVAGVGAALGATLAALAPGPPVALLGFVVAGLTLSLAAPTIFGLAGRTAPDGAQGSAISFVTTVSYLGFVIGPPLVGGVAGLAGLRTALLVLAAIGLLLAVLSPVLAREPRLAAASRQDPARG